METLEIEELIAALNDIGSGLSALKGIARSIDEVREELNEIRHELAGVRNAIGEIE